MTGEMIGSNYLNAAAQFGSNLGASVLSGTVSGLGAVGSGLSSGANYLSQLSQQAMAPAPQYAPQRTMQTQSNLNIPSASSGGFSSGTDFSVFNSTPTLVGKSSPPSSLPSTPQAQGGIMGAISGLGEWISGGAQRVGQVRQMPEFRSNTQAGQSAFRPEPAQAPTLTSKSDIMSRGSLETGNIKLQSPPGGETTSVFMGEGKGQREVKDAKVVIDTEGGSFGVYQARPARPGFTPVYGFEVAGGSSGAAQSGMFSTKPLSPLVYTQEGDKLAASANKEAAADILAHPELYSRPGAEAYGGYVQKLDNRILGLSNLMSTYAPESGNLANLANPVGANLSKSQMANEKVPWQIEWGGPAIQTVSPKKDLVGALTGTIAPTSPLIIGEGQDAIPSSSFQQAGKTGILPPESINDRLSGYLGIQPASAAELTDTGQGIKFANEAGITRENAIQNADILKSDLQASQKAILAAGAKGGYNAKGDFEYEYDPTNQAQLALHDDIIKKQSNVDSAVTTANAIPSSATTKKEDTGFLGAIGGAWEGGNKWVSENVTKKYIPSYESVGMALLKYPDIAVEGISGAQKSIGMKPLYEKTNAYDLLPSQKFLAYNRPEGFEKTVVDLGTGKQLTVTTGGMSEDNLVGTGARFTQSAIRGAFDMPREKPLEAATWLLMPGGFKAAEGVLGTVGTKLAPKLAASPYLADAFTIGKTALMGKFVAEEGAKVPGYTFDIAAPLTGGNEGRILGRTIEGYDEKGNPIYASQSATASGTRFGEFAGGGILMTAGSGIVAPYKFAYKEKLSPPVETPLTRAGARASGYLESKLQPGVEKFYKIGDVAKVLGESKRTTEITEKPLDVLSGSREKFITSEESPITIPERGAFGTLETGATVTKPVSFSERFAVAKDIWKSSGNKDIIRSTSRIGNVMPTPAFETQPRGLGEVKIEAKAPSVEKTWSETKLPTFTKIAQKFTGGTSESPVTASVQPSGVAGAKLQYQNVVPQRNLQFARDLSPLEQEAYESLRVKVQTGEVLGKSGVFSEKGSIGAQATEAADVGITGKVTGKTRGVGDIDILSEKPEVFNKLMADEIGSVLTGRGYSNVNVKVISPEGRRFDFKVGGKTYNVLPERVSGFRNYANRAYEITAKSPEGKPISYKMDSGIDLKLYGMDQPLAAGEGRYNVRSLFTPAEERSSGLVNTLFLTPGAMAVSMPKSIGETMFGPSTFRQKFKEDYVTTQEGVRFAAPEISSAVEATSAKPTSVSRLYSTFTDKLDNIRQTSRMSLSRNPSAIEENAKFGKSVWDANNIYTKFKTRYEENLKSGLMSPKEKVYAESKLQSMEQNLKVINDATIEMRTPSGDIKRFKVADLVKKYDEKVQSQMGGRAIEATPNTMSPFEAVEARVLTSGKSAAVMTPRGMAELQISTPGRVGGVGEVTGSIRPDVSSFNVKEKSDSKSKGKGTSASASSGVKIPLLASIGISKRSSASELKPSASASSGKSEGIPKSSEESKGKSEGKSESSGKSSSSFSTSSIYSGSSSTSRSPSESSGSSSSSMGSRSGSSSSGLFGPPFLAPGGGGGGGGGGRRGATGVIQNPLDALRVASAKKFKTMFDFTLPNALAKDVSKNLKQTQPYGTSGAAGAFSRGASSSVEEAMSIGIKQPMTMMRRTTPVGTRKPMQEAVDIGSINQAIARMSKKSKPNMKSKKKKGTYK